MSRSRLGVPGLRFLESLGLGFSLVSETQDLDLIHVLDCKVKHLCLGQDTSGLVLASWVLWASLVCLPCMHVC